MITITKVILLPSADSRKVVASYKGKYVHEVLVNHLIKLAQKKVRLGEYDSLYMAIAVDWDIKSQIKQKQQHYRKMTKKLSLSYFKSLCKISWHKIWEPHVIARPLVKSA